MRPATDRQRAYAEHLGLTIPADADTALASDLISNRLDGPAPSALLAYARHWGITPPADRPTSPRLLHRLIGEALSRDQYLRAGVSWWLASVAEDRMGAGIDSPLSLEGNAGDIDAKVDAFLSAPGALDSLRRLYPEDQLLPLTITSFASEPNGDEKSRRTKAYKAAAELFPTDTRRHTDRPTRQPERRVTRPVAPHLPWVLIALAAAAIIAALLI